MGAAGFPIQPGGSGAKRDPSDETLVRRHQIQLHEAVYRQVVGHLYLGLGYFIDDFFDITDERRLAGQATRFSAYPYGTTGRSLSSGLTVSALWDGRDSTVQPTQGSYLLARLRVEPALLGSDEDWRSVYLDGRTYY